MRDIIESTGLSGMDVRGLLDEGFAPEDATVVETWLLSGRAYGVLMGAFEAQPDHADAGGWAAACDVLEALG